MTVGEWVRTRVPAPPTDLAARILAVMGSDANRPAAHASDVLLASGERLVSELLRNRNTMRDSALDLLTADALVTYAFEAAGETPGDVEARATAAMMTIASIHDGSGVA